jgi:A/G-specific adenine glycosylase
MSFRKFKLSSKDKVRFEGIQSDLYSWYKKNRREFSWRKKIRDPYEVMVCEVMGQQTQASRIQEYLPRFVKRFPTIESLAHARKSDLIKQWQGLGYNRRALNLQRTAIELSGKPFPKKVEELLKLPGIGKYTANAILIFAFNQPLAAVDVNVERVLSRLYRRMPDHNTMLSKDIIFPLSQSILPLRNSRLWHEALMDFGATVCTKRNPKCDQCPLYLNCKSNTIEQTISKPAVARKEKIYFGHPKRIWRGRVLRIISSQQFSTEKFIINSLENLSREKEFVFFIRSIINDLISEGFCSKKNNRYYLHEG